jgi:hypothetical protein
MTKQETKAKCIYKIEGLFRDLNDKEVEEFKQWARDNYVIGSPISSFWHPVVVEECIMMNEKGDALYLIEGGEW